MEDRVVDYHGRPVSYSSTNGWTSALFIIVVEMAEKLSYYGIGSNLISYLTGPLRESTALGAANENIWSGMASSLALIGAFVADSWLGRYKTVLYSSILTFLGLLMLTLSATLPFLDPSKCVVDSDETTSCPSNFQVLFFFCSLYFIAFAHGGHKPCTQAFGADQFDTTNPSEVASRSSFFNYWYFGVCIATVTSQLVITYIQDNFGWSIGFGIPCFAMGISSIVFFAGRKRYWYHLVAKGKESPFVRIIRMCGESVKFKFPHWFSSEFDNGIARETLLANKYSNEIELRSISSPSISDKEIKSLPRLFPIWSCCLVYCAVSTQPVTFFTTQGRTMERHIGSSFEIPPAALQAFITLATIISLPIYDSFFVPFTRKLTGHPSGISVLQRIGIGMILSILSIGVAALVETKRLAVAKNSGLVDRPDMTVPMSIWWLLPQNILLGLSDAFATVGLQEFFYDQVPDCLRSLGMAFYLCLFGFGRFLSGFLVSFIDRVTGGNEKGWFASNLNEAHLDYFFWLLAGLGVVSFAGYSQAARTYVYKKND